MGPLFAFLYYAAADQQDQLMRDAATVRNLVNTMFLKVHRALEHCKDWRLFYDVSEILSSHQNPAIALSIFLTKDKEV